MGIYVGLVVQGFEALNVEVAQGLEALYGEVGHMLVSLGDLTKSFGGGEGVDVLLHLTGDW
jgi:hypothetical protein